MKVTEDPYGQAKSSPKNSNGRRKSIECRKELVTCEECSNTVTAHRDARRKTKAYLELNPAREDRDNKKD